MELLYMNEAQDDFTLYYDEETFKAFRALNPRPMIDESVPIDEPLTNNADEVRALLDDPRTHVYVAGQEKLKEQLDVALARNAGSEEAWQHEKAALVADGRWSELYY
jgi:ferredoxin--NADP+ reductase